MDRLITIRVEYFDRETEVAIAAARGGISRDQAALVVDLVRRLRQRATGRHRPSLRAAIMIARVVVQRGAAFDVNDPVFTRTCRDVLGLDGRRPLGDCETHPADPLGARIEDVLELVESA
jgi:hypothetical protein